MRQSFDSFTDLKIKVTSSIFLFQMLKEYVVRMILTNKWILKDPNLDEDFYHLQEAITFSEKDLEDLLKQIVFLEKYSVFFPVTDFQDEFFCIQENIYLEVKYIINMIDYIESLKKISDSNRLEEIGNCYFQKKEKYLESMNFNHYQLKKIKKERSEEHLE